MRLSGKFIVDYIELKTLIYERIAWRDTRRWRLFKKLDIAVCRKTITIYRGATNPIFLEMIGVLLGVTIFFRKLLISLPLTAELAVRVSKLSDTNSLKSECYSHWFSLTSTLLVSAVLDRLSVVY